MNVFLVWQVDHLDLIIEEALSRNDRSKLTSFSQDLQRAAGIVKSWAMASGGSSVMDHCAIGVVEVPADRMTQLSDIRTQFTAACSAAMSVGVGMDLKEAHTALKVAQSRGGDQIALYMPELEEELTQPDPMALGKAEGESPAPSDSSPAPEAPTDPKQAVAQALQDLKANAKALEHLKETNPEAFRAVVDTVHALIAMAQGLPDEEPG